VAGGQAGEAGVEQLDRAREPQALPETQNAVSPRSRGFAPTRRPQQPWEQQTRRAPPRSLLSKQGLQDGMSSVKDGRRANDEHVYLIKVLLTGPKVSSRVLFGSDFYVVENAELEERRRSVRLRAVVGEELFGTIDRENP